MREELKLDLSFTLLFWYERVLVLLKEKEGLGSKIFVCLSPGRKFAIV